MSGLKGEQVSSNWKKLQEKLQAAKKQDPAQSNGVKRKRTEDDHLRKKSVNGFKKPTITDARLNKALKRRRMGATTSTPDEQADSSTQRSQLSNKHDIPREDVSAAYGVPSQSYKDDINSGRHPVHKAGKYVALDCEMVGTGPPPTYPDHILARASLVNFHGEQIYDSYVLPPVGYTLQDIKDYRTFVSGIKPEHLKPGIARTFADVQRDVAELLHERVLVGHALRNDLSVLMLSHPKRDLRDTSRYAKFRVESRGKPPALRNLARTELGLAIQSGEHSSVEDARAAMGLFRKEKVGFEEENRRAFGVKRAPVTKPGMATNGKIASVKEDEDEDEVNDDDDLDLLDGEDDGLGGDDAPAVSRSTSTPMVKKKHKKKKRTKRK